MSKQRNQTEIVLSSEVMRQIVSAISEVRFGCVQVTIHNSRVVQIEKSEKIRLESSANLTTGGAQQSLSRDDRTSGDSRLISGR